MQEPRAIYVPAKHYLLNTQEYMYTKKRTFVTNGGQQDI